MRLLKQLSVWTWLWIGWLLAFLAIEIPAALLPGDGTLSRHVWDWFSWRSRKAYWLARRLVFVVFWTLLGFGHFVLQGPALWTVILPGIPFGAVIVWSTFFEEEASMSTFRWKTALWKGLRPALIASATAFVASVAAEIDVALLIKLGIPAALATFLIEAGRNYLKQHGLLK